MAGAGSSRSCSSPTAAALALVQLDAGSSRSALARSWPTAPTSSTVAAGTGSSRSSPTAAAIVADGPDQLDGRGERVALVQLDAGKLAPRARRSRSSFA